MKVENDLLDGQKPPINPIFYAYPNPNLSNPLIYVRPLGHNSLLSVIYLIVITVRITGSIIMLAFLFRLLMV